ncbi:MULTISPECIES: DUF3349 domain-containing protein [Nocardia]|uniref:DUF3349 domain-containing protein n=1 Tax=Nocardia TaxID=1817 RepID=UPI0015EF42EE|nr:MULTISPECIES: DUF3349 domain-containing protein [Nocardia]
MTENTSILDAVLRWLRAGYPQAIPREDYVALFAVLHRKLTDTEVETLALQLADGAGDGGVDRGEIERAIAELAFEQPGPDDVARVASRLAADGWPLADPIDA